MTKYFDNPDNSLEDSIQGPLKELDLNDSDSFLEISPKRSVKSGRYFSDALTSGKKNRSIPNKENVTGVDKLPVFHRSQHGEQYGTLIVRHHVQKDSKCIQCRNCGIFFNTVCFLRHCHDQYGKRAQCNAVQLQLGLDFPTNQQKDVWNNFQKKLISESDDLPLARPDSSAARHILNLNRPNERVFRPIAAVDRDRQRTRRSSVEIPAWRRTDECGSHSVDSPRRQTDATLFRSRKFASSSALNEPQESLSLSELRPERQPARMASSYGPADRESRRALHVGRMANYDRLLPNRIELRALNYDQHCSSAPPARSEFYNPLSYEFEGPLQPRLWDTPNNADEKLMLPPKSMSIPLSSVNTTDQHTFKTLPETQPILDPIAGVQRSFQELSGGMAKKEATDEKDPKDVIIKAISLLQTASERISRDKGQSSSAWRKMYEEERDHRMRLEEKVRDLERKLRSKRT